MTYGQALVRAGQYAWRVGMLNYRRAAQFDRALKRIDSYRWTGQSLRQMETRAALGGVKVPAQPPCPF